MGPANPKHVATDSREESSELSSNPNETPSTSSVAGFSCGECRKGAALCS